MKVLLRNTADHFLVPGDVGQVLEIEGTEYRVVEVVATPHQPMILTYGLRLIPVQVDVVLESNTPVVVQ